MSLYGDMMRKLTATMVCLGLSCGLNGCFLHKKTQAVVLPQAQAPVTVASTPASVSGVMVEAPPVNVPPEPIAAAAAKPKREHKKQAAKTVSAPPPATTAPAPPTQVASATEAVGEGSAIGELTAGGDASAQTLQEAADLIASNEKRLSALPADMAKDKKSQINKIWNFQRQAQKALSSGDAEGAKTLATKARLLLYDLDRSGGE